MLDYKDIITKHYALGMSGTKIAESLKVSKSGVNDFLRAFKACPTLDYPLPEGITNYGIASVLRPSGPADGRGRPEPEDQARHHHQIPGRGPVSLHQAVPGHL